MQFLPFLTQKGSRAMVERVFHALLVLRSTSLDTAHRHPRKGSEGPSPSGSPGIPSPDKSGLAGVWEPVLSKACGELAEPSKLCPPDLSLTGGREKVRIAFLLTKC